MNADDRREVTAHFTGHRPKYLVGREKEVKLCIKKLTEYAIKQGKNTFISGMAAGVDIEAARYILSLIEKGEDLYLIGAVPFDYHYSRWPLPAIKDYKDLINRIINNGRCEIYQVSTGDYSYYKLNKRNEWMAKRASICLGVYIRGNKGGTYNQLKDSSTRGLETIYYDPITLIGYKVNEPNKTKGKVNK